jgi:hypothetical protein
MANHVAIGRPRELRPLPECVGQGLKADRAEETLAILHDLFRCGLALFEDAADFIGRRRGQDVNVAPFLRPHITEQVGGNHAVRALRRRAILLHQLPAGIGVDLFVERLHFCPEPFQFGRELRGRHVVI